jgi:hypothetical protein
MDADSDPHRTLRLLGGCVRRPFGDREPCSNGLADRLEDDVEAIALGADLCALEAGDGLPDEIAVSDQQLGRCNGAVALDEVGIAPQVGEEETSRGG